jgi:Zn-finger nucleic acid-binding protein
MTTCPKCGGVKFKRWDDLDEEQKMIVERLPASAEFSLENRRQQSRWCTRCFYEMRPEPGMVEIG